MHWFKSFQLFNLLVTFYKEQGASYKNTTRTFNAVHCALLQLPKVGVTAIYNTIQCTKHIISSTTTIAQTNQDNLLHCQAPHNWLAQLLVRMGGELPPIQDDEESKFRKRLDNDWIDKEKLTQEGHTFVPEQVAYWDDIHIYQVVRSEKRASNFCKG